MTVVFSSRVCVTLGYTLLHSTWILSLICGAALLVMRKRRSNMEAMHSIGMGSLLLGAVVIAAWFIWGPVPAAPEISVGASVLHSETDTITASRQSVPGQILPARNFSMAAEQSARDSTDAPATAPHAALTAPASRIRPLPQVTELSAHQPDSLTQLAGWLAPAWLTGVCMLSFRWVVALQKTRRLALTSREGPAELSDRLTDSCRNWCGLENLQLLVSDAIRTPMVVGIFRAAIIVPAALISQLSPDQWDAVLVHELMHIRRRDAVTNLVQIFVETIFFYHPMVWAVGRQVRLARECCCDQMAIERTGKPLALGEALFLIEKHRTADRVNTREISTLVAAVGDGAPGATLIRIRRLLQTPVEAEQGNPGLADVLLIALLILSVLAGWPAINKSDDNLLPSPLAVVRGALSTKILKTIAAADDQSGKADPASPKPWEVSRIHDAATLRYHYLIHEAPPIPIQVPAVNGRVFRPDGQALPYATIASHTPRQWLRLNVPMPTSGPNRKASIEGRFELPQRNEPYRVLVTDKSGIASMSHEELIRAGGQIHLRPWAAARGTFILDGKPQAGQRIILRFNTLKWSFSRGGPRLTAEYKTITDENGQFQFPRVPPLPASAYVHDRALQRCISVEFRSGKTANINFGEGVNVSGRLPESVVADLAPVETQKSVVRLRPLSTPIPYPEALKSDKQAQEEWREKWSRTAEGFALSDRNFVLLNTNYYGTLQQNGEFVLTGIPPGDYDLLVYQGVMELLRREIRVGTKDFRVSVDPNRPNLRVVVVEPDGSPVKQALIAVYDRNNFQAGQPMDFERRTAVTDDYGKADLGPLPQDYVCVEVFPQRKLLDSSYAVIYRDTRFRQTRPLRYNVSIREAPAATTAERSELSLEFTLRKGLHINFTVEDDKSGEAIFWPEIYFRDQQQWWNFAIIDGGGQYDFVTVGPEISRVPMMVTASGYFSRQFQFDEQLTTDKEYDRQLTLRRAPKLRLTVLSADGTPAAHAQLSWKTLRRGLDSTRVLKQSTGADGTVTIDYPPGGEFKTMTVKHPTGTAILKIADLDLADADPERTFDVSIRLNAE